MSQKTRSEKEANNKEPKDGKWDEKRDGYKKREREQEQQLESKSKTTIDSITRPEKKQQI